MNVRRYLWIVVSCVLPLAFLIIMKTRPPRTPGEVSRVGGYTTYDALDSGTDGLDPSDAGIDGGVDGGEDGVAPAP